MKMTPFSKNYFKYLVFAGMVAISATSCKDSEDPNPREAFVGEYEAEDFDLHVTTSTSSFDSIFTLTSNPKMEFIIDDDLDADELEMDIEEFVKDVMQETLGSVYGVSFTINFDDLPITEISGNEFELDEYEFETTVVDGMTSNVYPCEIVGEGELVGNELTFEFELKLILLPGQFYEFEGTAVAMRD